MQRWRWGTSYTGPAGPWRSTSGRRGLEDDRGARCLDLEVGGVHREVEGKRPELVARTRALSTAQDSKLHATAHKHEGCVRAVAHPEKARHMGALPAHGIQHGLAACTVPLTASISPMLLQ